MADGWAREIQPTQASGMIDTLSAKDGSPDKGYLLQDEATLKQIVRDAVAYAGQLGFDQVVASANESAGVTIKVRGGVPESAVRDGGQGLSVMVFDHGRLGAASTGTLTTEALRETVRHAIAIARHVVPDEQAGLADPEWLAYDADPVALYAPSGLSAADVSDVAIAVEAAALHVEGPRGVHVRVLEAGAASHDSCSAHAIGKDFCRGVSASVHSRWCVAVAERGGEMVRDHWTSVDRRVGSLDSAEAIARLAVGGATRKLGARPLSSRGARVLLHSRIAASFVHELCGALGGAAQHQKTTFLSAPLGKDVLPAHVDLTENPFEPYGLASGACDSEGVAAQCRHIVRGGVVEGYFLSSLWARKLGMRSTGNANGAWNLTLTSRNSNGSDDLNAMLRRLDCGLLVTEFLGGKVNSVTGAYSKAVTGFWVEGGAIAFPVHDITIAGNIIEMIRELEVIGTDVHRAGAIRTGSILLGSIQIAGR